MSAERGIRHEATEKSIQDQHGLDHNVRVVKIGPGEHHVTEGDDELIVTVLGSCVAACVRDAVARVGGMNHFMLPESENGKWGGASASLRFGNYAMERLVNDILMRGGRRERLEVKLMGGGKVLDNCVDVGARNADFAESYARAEGLQVLATDLRGNHARRVHFMPVRGRLWLKRLHRTEIPVVGQAESAYYKRIEKTDVGGSVELF